jgi:hypothetical protein
MVLLFSARLPVLVATSMPPPAPVAVLPLIVLLFIVNVPEILIPPPDSGVEFPSTTTLFSVTVALFPTVIPPPFPGVATAVAPFCIRRLDIVTWLELKMTSNTRSMPPPSTIVLLEPAPLIVTKLLAMSRSPVAAAFSLCPPIASV